MDDSFGSHDTGDPTTTNLYVGNLSPQVTEEILSQEFNNFGTITSLKIMWPRTDEDKKRGKNCGFVSFDTREAAEQAKREMHGIVFHVFHFGISTGTYSGCITGKDLLGHELRIGWGKAVPRSQPLPMPLGMLSL
jgi:U2-associated protein SR140